MRTEQEEELEVLESIYEGDANFTVINKSTFQYKYEDDCGNKSFIVELIWNEEYPDVAPVINLDLFYNKHLMPDVKAKIKNGLLEQADLNLGIGMTFTLFDWVKEVKEELLKEQPTELQSSSSANDVTNGVENLDLCEDSVKKKKEHLTKAQKRKMWDRQTADGERARGFDWVDIIKHLSQTGNSTSTG